MSVLLVDDDDISNYLNKRVVEKSGYFKRVDICNSAQAAIQILTERNEADEPLPKLILLDIMMPVMDGFAFLEELNRRFADNHKHFKVAMLTSSLCSEDMNKAMKYPQVVAYLNKPLDKTIFEKLASELNA